MVTENKIEKEEIAPEEVLEEVEVEGKEIEDAIAESLARLGIAKEDAIIEIIDEGKKGGLFGIGGKNAKVKVRRKTNPITVITELIKELTLLLDDTVIVKSIKYADGRYYCDIESENLAIVLGRRGKTLDALQVLVSVLASKKVGTNIRLTLDASGFREKRYEVLTQIAKDASKEAIKYGQRVHLEPMSAHDRKIIHSVLSNSSDVITESEDSGDRRHIVIIPKNLGEKKSRKSSDKGERRPRRREKEGFEERD